MKIFSDVEAGKNFPELLFLAKSEEIEIHKEDGSTFLLSEKRQKEYSPFDVPGIKTKATMEDIFDAIQDSRSK